MNKEQFRDVPSVFLTDDQYLEFMTFLRQGSQGNAELSDEVLEQFNDLKLLDGNQVTDYAKAIFVGLLSAKTAVSLTRVDPHDSLLCTAYLGTNLSTVITRTTNDGASRYSAFTRAEVIRHFATLLKLFGQPTPQTIDVYFPSGLYEVVRTKDLSQTQQLLLNTPELNDELKEAVQRGDWHATLVAKTVVLGSDTEVKKCALIVKIKGLVFVVDPRDVNGHKGRSLPTFAIWAEFGKYFA